jgi:hypothetical protein
MQFLSKKSYCKMAKTWPGRGKVTAKSLNCFPFIAKPWQRIKRRSLSCSGRRKEAYRGSILEIHFEALARKLTQLQANLLRS